MVVCVAWVVVPAWLPPVDAEAPEEELLFEVDELLPCPWPGDHLLPVT